MKYNAKSSPILTRFFILLAFALCELSAFAATATWTGAGDGANWFDDQNWDTHVKPDISTDVRINNGAKVTIGGGSASARSLVLGLLVQDSGTLQVVAGGSLTLPSYTSSGDFPVEGAIYVGCYGRGTLSITNGGTVTSSVGWIAAFAGEVTTSSNGVVIVDGTGSKWTLNGGGPNLRLCVGCIGSGTVGIDGGTGLLSITNGGVVYSTPNSFDVAGWVGSSGTLTGNATFSAGDASSAATVLQVKGTLAPSKSLRIDATPKLLSPATTVCDVTSQDVNIVNLAVSRKAVLGGRLQVTMTGPGFTPGMRFTLLHAGEGLNFQNMFDSFSITYLLCPTCMPMFTPVIQYDYNGGNVYLYLDPD